VRVADLNWMLLEEYLGHDDRIFPGSPRLAGVVETREVLANL
jgi:hypothetical protein